VRNLSYNVLVQPTKKLQDCGSAVVSDPQKCSRKGKASNALPSEGPPEDARRSTEVDGTLLGLRVETFPQEALILHLLTHDAPRDHDFLAAHQHLSKGNYVPGSDNGNVVAAGNIPIDYMKEDTCQAIKKQREPNSGALTICCPFRSCLAKMEASRPSICPRASTTTVFCTISNKDQYPSCDEQPSFELLQRHTLIQSKQTLTWPMMASPVVETEHCNERGCRLLPGVEPPY
jgi:hypothetical protein